MSTAKAGKGSLPDVEVPNRLRARLEEEIERAKYFRRRVVVLMVRAARLDIDPLSRWYPRVLERLRPVDWAVLYGAETVGIVAPELDATRALALAATIAEIHAEGTQTLAVGLSIFPDNARGAEELIEASVRALERTTADQRVRFSTSEPPGGEPADDAADDAADAAPIVRSPAMREIFEHVDRLARTTISVLLYGETGTGKEILARAIHERGPRRDEPLVYLNCGAIPSTLVESTLFGHERGSFSGAIQRQRGAFEAAHGGTLVLDEIGDLPLTAQAVLLRVLENKRVRRVGAIDEIDVDVRFIAATNRDLESMCDAGEFRSDLFYRLSGMTVTIPPLRDRREEIAPLAQHFLARARRAWNVEVHGIEPQAATLLHAYDWPGNIRELRNVVERAVVMTRSTLIATQDLPDRLRGAAVVASSRPETAPVPAVRSYQPVEADSEPTPSGDLKAQIQHHEKRIIIAALGECGDSPAGAAHKLGIPERTLRHKMKYYGIKRLGYTAR